MTRGDAQAIAQSLGQGLAEHVGPLTADLEAAQRLDAQRGSWQEERSQAFEQETLEAADDQAWDFVHGLLAGDGADPQGRVYPALAQGVYAVLDEKIGEALARGADPQAIWADMQRPEVQRRVLQEARQAMGGAFAQAAALERMRGGPGTRPS